MLPPTSYTEQDVRRHRVQVLFKLHGISAQEIAEELELADGHVRHILFYGRGEGRGYSNRVWEHVTKKLGFDPREQLTPEVKNFLLQAGNAPVVERPDVLAQG